MATETVRPYPLLSPQEPVFAMPDDTAGRASVGIDPRRRRWAWDACGVDAKDRLDSLRELFDTASAEGATSLVLNFDDLVPVLGGLPQDAYTKKGWWTGSRQPHVAAWMAAGWKVDVVGFRMRRVSFRRV